MIISICKMLSAEKINENWLKYRKLCALTGDRSEAILKMIDALDTRLALCPASSRKDYHNAFPGGLVDHSLRVLSNAKKIIDAFGWNVSSESLIIACLFHDLGKVGDHENDYYIKQNDQWRLDKLGEMYTHNKKLQYMTVPDRSIFLCQYFGVKLEPEEMLAIKLNDGQYAEENAPYKMKEPMLADIVHIADIIATKQEKGILS